MKCTVVNALITRFYRVEIRKFRVCCKLINRHLPKNKIKHKQTKPLDVAH